MSEPLLETVIRQYVESGDFNGLPLSGDTLSAAEFDEARRLVQDGLVQVVTADDYVNMHIRPWASQRSIEQQVDDLEHLGDRPTACLYPTPRAMEGRPELDRWQHEPYRQRMAAGAGTLELAYFSVDVIEQYRNDPRYHYRFDDFEVVLGINDDAYADENEREADKIPSTRIGFAYDSTTLRSDAVTRYACTFVGDLAELTPEHQQRWRTYEVDPNDSTGPHPMWWQMQMGQWPDGKGPFQRILDELAAINELFVLIADKPLFRTTDHPREWGWVIRPTTQEWHQFLLATDKLLSENIDHKALDAVGAPTEGEDGNRLGSLNRLVEFIRASASFREELLDAIAVPLKRVRKGRQEPAHKLTVAQTDAKLTAQQRDLLADVGEALLVLREVLAKHPRCGDWEPGYGLEDKVYEL
jgi:hypothetical protein